MKNDGFYSRSSILKTAKNAKKPRVNTEENTASFSGHFARIFMLFIFTAARY